MRDPRTYYLQNIEQHDTVLAQLKKQLNLLSTFRLGVFVALVLGIYLFRNQIYFVAPLSIVLIGVFIILVSKHANVKYHRDKTAIKIDFFKKELDVLNGNFQHLPNGEKLSTNIHAYAQDLDLFGRGSFFQYFNRTALYDGEQLITQLLLENNIQNIPDRQESIKELAKLTDWRFAFQAEAELFKLDINNDQIIQWLQKYQSFIPNTMRRFIPAFGGVSLLVLSLWIFGIIPFVWPLCWFLSGMMISGIFLKRINSLSSLTHKIQKSIEQYSKLIGHIENQSFHTSLLKSQKEHLKTTEKTASSLLKAFSRLLDVLDQRNNVLISIPLNGFFLRDIYVVHKLETWIATHQKEVKVWFEVVVFFDAYNTLGNFAFNHPEFSYPQLQPSNAGIKAENLGHPLLKKELRVNNPFEIKDASFFIITGANMAGKSTFLRTVGLSIVMANMGLPVCADNYSYYPIKLITSMRASDSLSESESYFFSELKRLKFIIEQLQNEHYFIILDEILKGTNSKDKAEGSMKFVNRLVRSKSVGLIATHDLSLCQLGSESEQVHNYFFEAEIIDDQLHFDYKLKKGICQNMNASFLLSKMKIV